MEPTPEKPQLAFRTRAASDHVNATTWTTLDYCPWVSTISDVRRAVASMMRRDVGLVREPAPELWRCDANGHPETNGLVVVPPLLLLQQTATTCPSTPNVDLLLKTHPNGMPQAFLLFTLPVTLPPSQDYFATKKARLRSLASYLRQLNPDRQPQSCPITSIGSAFPALNRDAAMETLAKGVASRYALYQQGPCQDGMVHPPYMVTAPAGAGKTRLLWDAQSLLHRHFCESSTDANAPALAEIVGSGIRAYVTYGKGRSSLRTWENGFYEGQGGLAIRLLRAHFCPHMDLDELATLVAWHFFGVTKDKIRKELSLSDVLCTIAYDLCQKDVPDSVPGVCDTPKGYFFALITLDDCEEVEFDALKGLISELRSAMVVPRNTFDNRTIFILSILSGATKSRISCAAPNGRPSIPLLVPPLQVHDFLSILQIPELLPATTSELLRDPQFLRLLGDVAGHPQYLEYLVQLIRSEMAQTGSVNVHTLRALLQDRLRAFYDTLPISFSQDQIDIIRKAILNRCMPSGDETQMGFLIETKEDGKRRYEQTLFAPWMLLDGMKARWMNDLSFQSVRHLFAEDVLNNPEELDEWQHFEMEVFRCEALRLACSTFRNSTWDHVMQGAIGMHRVFWVCDIGLTMDDCTIALADQLPFAKSSQSTYAELKPDVHNAARLALCTYKEQAVELRRIKMGLNAKGAPFSMFSTITIEGRQGLMCMQTIHTSQLPGELVTLKQVRAEYKQIAAAMSDVNLRKYFGVPRKPRVPFAVLLYTLKPLASDITAEALPRRCFVVGRGQFSDYFGRILGVRLEMIARGCEAQVALNMSC